jgi:SEC-C motif
MTLILALGNSEHTVLLADRQHSSDTGPIPGEFTKALVLELSDARLAVAFTGLAEQPRRGEDTFRTRFWLADALSEASEPNPSLESTVARFQEIASRDIVKVPVDQPFDRALTIFLAGYLYRDSEPKRVLRRVSNFEGVRFDSPRSPIPTTDFTVAPYDSGEDASYVITGGFDAGVPDIAKQQLKQLVANRRPPEALIAKAVEVLQDAAKSPKSKGKVGAQCLSIVLPIGRDTLARGGYHSPNVGHFVSVPGLVEARGGHFGRLQVMDAQFSMSGSPLNVPKAARNAPCPCGSDVKYKKCHGRPGQSEWRMVLGNQSMEWRG